MRTIEKIKDQVAKDQGFDNWQDLSKYVSYRDADYISVIKEAQKDAVNRLCDLISLEAVSSVKKVLTEIENQ